MDQLNALLAKGLTVAAAVVVTAILCPFMTNWISKHTGKEVKTTFSQVEEKVAEENATY